MKNKTRRDRFRNNLKKIDEFLRRSRIAVLESQVEPDFSDHNPQYAEITFTPLNRDIFEDIIIYINRRELEFSIPMSIKVIDDEKNNRYTLIICPHKGLKIPKNRELEEPYLLEETEKFIAHIAPIIRDYQMKYH